MSTIQQYATSTEVMSTTRIPRIPVPQGLDVHSICRWVRAFMLPMLVVLLCWYPFYSIASGMAQDLVRPGALNEVQADYFLALLKFAPLFLVVFVGSRDMPERNVPVH